MSIVRVIIPPDPIVAPADIPGVSSGDLVVAGYIAAATAEIDGPDGWLGRCLGVQTLEYSGAFDPCEPFFLPCPPLIRVVSVMTVDHNNVETAVSDDDYFVVGSELRFIRSHVRGSTFRIRYEAGYDGDDVLDGGTGELPAQVKVAIIMSVSQLRSISALDPFKKVDFVEGVGRTEFAVDGQISKVMTDTANRLIAGLRVYR